MVSAIADVVGNAAIVLTLIFVGLELAEGNRETRSVTVQASLDAEMSLIRTLVDHAATWDKWSRGRRLQMSERHEKRYRFTTC
jgi:hypothetical protein